MILKIYLITIFEKIPEKNPQNLKSFHQNLDPDYFVLHNFHPDPKTQPLCCPKITTRKQLQRKCSRKFTSDLALMPMNRWN